MSSAGLRTTTALVMIYTGPKLGKAGAPSFDLSMDDLPWQTVISVYRPEVDLRAQSKLPAWLAWAGSI
jgi:hypothetical protein